MYALKILSTRNQILYRFAVGVSHMTLVQRSAAGGAGGAGGDTGVSLIDMPKHDAPVTDDKEREEQKRGLFNKQVRHLVST